MPSVKHQDSGYDIWQHSNQAGTVSKNCVNLFALSRSHRRIASISATSMSMSKPALALTAAPLIRCAAALPTCPLTRCSARTTYHRSWAGDHCTLKQLLRCLCRWKGPLLQLPCWRKSENFCLIWDTPTSWTSAYARDLDTVTRP